MTVKTLCYNIKVSNEKRMILIDENLCVKEGKKMGKFKRPEKGDKPVEVGSWLIQDVEHIQQQTVYIDMDEIKPNEKNAFSKEEIEKLAQMIKLGEGIWQDLVVKPKNAEGFYELTTGERRWRAAQLLRDRGEYPQTLQNKVPCTIKDPNTLVLPLSSESKEMFSILVTNQYRDKTDGDRMMEYQEWKKIFGELRKQGIVILYDDGSYLTKEELKNMDEGKLQEIHEENKVGKQISGVKTRDLLAESMGVSTGQISRFETVKKKASDAVLESLLSDEINLGEAEKLAPLPKAVQEKLLHEKRETNELPIDKIKNEKIKQVPNMVLNRQLFEVDIKEIELLFTGEAIEISNANYKLYKKCIAQLQHIFGGAQ